MKPLRPQTGSKTTPARPARWSGKAAVLLARSCRILIALVSLSLSTGYAQDQPGPVTAAPEATPVPPPSASYKRSAAELETLAMPIALHPDPLIAILLPAAAYPLEIVQAARFVKDTNNIPKVDQQPWDENVKAVAKFPELIAQMDADLTWTINLGQAFIDQPRELMAAIQELRSKAYQAGNLKTSPQQIVTVTNIVVLQTNVTEVVTVQQEIIEVAPASPTVIYVPTYPPAIYYPWYPYYVYAEPVVSFSVGFFWGAAWASHWHNHCNWSHGSVDIDIDTDRNIDRNIDRNRNTAGVSDRMNNAGNRGGADRQSWKADQNRIRQSGARPSTREARGWGSAGARPSTGNLGSRPSTGSVGSRPSTRPSMGNSSAQSSRGPTAGTRPSTSQFSGRNSYGNRSSSSINAFNRSGGGNSTRSYSYRGTTSRGGGGFRGGGGGFRGGGRR